MTIISEILGSYLIPYNKQLNKKMVSIYMTPNAVILYHSFVAISRASGILKLCDRINSISHDIVYICLEKITSETDYTAFINMMSKYVDITRVVIITDVNEIIHIPNIMNYSFGISHCGALWTLVMVDMHEIIQGRAIYVSSVVYNRAIAIMNDNELEILHTYNIIISDEEQYNLVYIIQDTHNNKEPFTFVIKFTPLDGGQRNAIRIIDNMTIQCESCNRIVYIDKKHDCINAK